MNKEKIMEMYLNEAFAPVKIEGELKNPNSFFYFLYDENALVAYMKVNLPPAQTDFNDSGSLELERIYVKKESIGKGYGKFLMQNTVSIAKEHGCTYIWLGVWEKNKPALAFYQKMGFEVFDQHPFRMGDEIQNDFVLKKPL
jgi:ribosomal protein S18 acetylase RimI-like enzyme